jgi:CO/xanthine dehydrogenase FAD-binding subunit
LLPRPALPSFEYVKATTPAQVYTLLQRDDVRLMMGGTDLLAQMRDGALCPRTVVDVKHLPGMRDIAYDAGAGLTIGAAVTMNQLARHPAVATHYPLLAQAAESVASYPLRNRATVGGNLCNASPCADVAPALLALEGHVVLCSLAGERQVPAEEFFLGPGETALGASEFMTALHVPVPPAGSGGRYLKLGRNKAGDLSIVGVAVFAWPDGALSSGYRFRIALASVAPVPLRALKAEGLLATQPPGAETFARAADEAAGAATPIDDVRASAAYRRAMVRALTLRALQYVWAHLHNTQ